MRKYYKIVSFMAVLLMCCTSCTKWLTVDTKDRIMEDKLFSTQDGFLVALNGVYIGLIDNGLYNGALTCGNVDIMAQYYDCTPVNHFAIKIASLEKNTTNFIFDDTWKKAYVLIGNINTIIEHCESGKGILGERYYNLYKGEALALRAFLHLDLLRIYGPTFSVAADVPNVMPYQDYSDVRPSPLLSSQKVSERIMADLYEAEKLLKLSDPIIENGPLSATIDGSNTFRFRNMRLNYYAVKAIIARASIHFNDKATALKYANEVIVETQEKNKYFPFSSADYILESGYQDRVFSSEILFSTYNLKRSKDLFENFFSSAKKTESSLNVSSNGFTFLYDGLGNIDHRYKTQWEERNNASMAQIRVLIKYELPEGNLNGKKNPLDFQYYVPLIRISEMYFIKAECLLDIDDQGALDAINVVRLARNVPDVVLTPGGRTPFEYLQFEFAREFIGEGQLFWFYKRNNMQSILNLGVGPDEEGVYKKVATDNGQFAFSIPRGSEADKRE